MAGGFLTPRLPLTKAFKGHTRAVRSVAYFRDGKRIISGSSDKTVRIWDLESQTQDGESLMHNFGVESMGLSPDERRLVSGGRGVTLWNLEDRTVRWKRDREEVDGFRVAYSPDGRLIAAGHNSETIVLLNAETGEQIGDAFQFGGFVLCLGFSPDGTRLGAGSNTGEIRVLDVATMETVIGPFEAHGHGVTSLVYSLDGQHLFTASQYIQAWDAATGQKVGIPMPAGHSVQQFALSPDGQRLASASDRGDCSIRVWDFKTRRQIGLGNGLQRQGRYSFTSVAWSPSGRSVVAGSDVHGRIFLWDVPPLNDHAAVSQAPAPTTSSPSLAGTSRSSAHSISSSILNLPAGPSPTPQSPEVNTGPGEDDNWEYATNESFDSVLDLPADGTQPAQRRKRRRRRGAPTTPDPPPAIPVLPNVSPRIDPPSIPPLNQASSPPGIDQPIPEAHAAPDSPPSRVGALRRLWRQRLEPALFRWTRQKPRESQPVHPSPAPNTAEPQLPSTPAASIHSEAATGPAETTTPQKPNVISRLLTRFKRPPTGTTPESIEMHPRHTPRRRNLTPHAQRQSEVVDVAAGRLDRRMAASSNKWTDEIDWLDYICFCMCCPWNKVISESDSERGQGAGGSSGSSSSSSSDRVSFNPDDIY